MDTYTIILTTQDRPHTRDYPGDARHERLTVASDHKLYHSPHEHRGYANAGRWHPGHNGWRSDIGEVALSEPRFAFGGCWYDDEAAWLAAWGATVVERVPCDAGGAPLRSESASVSVRLTQAQRRSVDCPTCGMRKGKPCRSSRIGSPNQMGGGWGGYPDLDREHPSRITQVRALGGVR
jgi:hypothetical protein